MVCSSRVETRSTAFLRYLGEFSWTIVAGPDMSIHTVIRMQADGFCAACVHIRHASLYMSFTVEDIEIA